MNNNIVLIGFMGSGKSTIGKKLYKKLNKTFVDIDDTIVNQEKRTINEIFQTEGEEYFRKIETECLESLTKKNNMVISTGGGVILREENRVLLKNIGKVIFLHADVNHIVNNVKNDDSRPLLKTDNYIETIRELLENREAKYLSAADIIIQTSGKDVESIINEILSLL